MVGTATFAMRPILPGAAAVRERRRLGRQVLRFPAASGWAGKPGVFLRSKAEVYGPACLLRATQGAAISASVISSMRLEKPHSLSYQLSTLTRVPPITRVWVAS